MVSHATQRGRDGAIVQTHRVKLPGHAIVGEGKPENQNLGMACVTGMYVQTIDMNQDCQLAEALKARNILAQFTGKTRLVGFPRADDHGSQRIRGVFRGALRASVRYHRAALHGETSVRSISLRTPRRVGLYLGAWSGVCQRRLDNSTSQRISLAA